jgi:hypothetical protein
MSGASGEDLIQMMFDNERELKKKGVKFYLVDAMYKRLLRKNADLVIEHEHLKISHEVWKRKYLNLCGTVMDLGHMINVMDRLQ